MRDRSERGRREGGREQGWEGRREGGWEEENNSAIWQLVPVHLFAGLLIEILQWEEREGGRGRGREGKREGGREDRMEN